MLEVRRGWVVQKLVAERRVDGGDVGLPDPAACGVGTDNADLSYRTSSRTSAVTARLSFPIRRRPETPPPRRSGAITVQLSASTGITLRHAKDISGKP